MGEDDIEDEIIPLDEDFIISGIKKNSTSSDKNLFEKIKKSIYDHSKRNSHSYKALISEFRASSIAYCGRKILLNKHLEIFLTPEQIELLPKWFLDEKSDKENIKFGSSTSGQFIHEVIQEALQDQVLGMEDEISLEVGQAKIVGHYDLLMEDESGEKIVIDIKSTMTPRSQLPNPSHTKQLMAYQGILGGIKGALLYVNRNSWQMSYVSQDFDKNSFSEIIAKVTYLASMEEKQILPTIDENIFNKECRTDYFKCQYFGFCFPNYQEDESEKDLI